MSSLLTTDSTDLNGDRKFEAEESENFMQENNDLIKRKSEIFQELSEKIDILENNQQSLVKDLNRITKLNDILSNENNFLKDSLIEYKKVCQDLHKILALAQVRMVLLEERLINNEKISFNGNFVWKINNVRERIQEAKSGGQISFSSPPFYLNQNGFKISSRIYLNGDGTGRNTHLSLFIVILKGEFDSLLKWPFKQKVRFILFDQSESKKHVVDEFKPDLNSLSFKRPISEFNMASGLPLFCSLAKLMSTDYEFIKDNTMFIMIDVDCEDIQQIC